MVALWKKKRIQKQNENWIILCKQARRFRTETLWNGWSVRVGERGDDQGFLLCLRDGSNSTVYEWLCLLKGFAPYDMDMVSFVASDFNKQSNGSPHSWLPELHRIAKYIPHIVSKIPTTCVVNNFRYRISSFFFFLLHILHKWVYLLMWRCVWHNFDFQLDGARWFNNRI